MCEISDSYELSDVNRAYGFYRLFNKMAKRLGFRGESDLWKLMCSTEKRALADVLDKFDDPVYTSRLICNREKIHVDSYLDGYVVEIRVNLSASQDLRLSSGEVLEGLYRVTLILRLSNPTWSPCSEPCTMFNMGNGSCTVNLIIYYEKLFSEPSSDLMTRFLSFIGFDWY